MTDPFKPLDITRLKTYSISERHSKVTVGDFARPSSPGASLADFFSRLPGMLGARALKRVIDAIAAAHQDRKTVAVGMGAHVIKTGLSPILIDLMERGVLTAVAMNGAGIIHDLEIALAGRTSEDVAASLGDGTFGMARETGAFLSEAIKAAGRDGIGLGAAVGRAILADGLPHRDQSVLAAAAARDLPATVHVAMGTDIIHMHPDFDPAAAGRASHLDFRRFAAVVASLEGGVYLNIGSAVVMPEVFLKALTLARNLGYAPRRFLTVDMDFIRHYRPQTNVVHRPTLEGGEGISLVGHHEIMVPLLAAGVIESLAR